MNRPVNLTVNDVQSVLLTREESNRLENEHNGRIRQYDHIHTIPFMKDYHEKKDKALDRLAQAAGFAQHDENILGTGLRNYTAQGKHQSPKVKQMIERYNELYANDAELKELNKAMRDRDARREQFVKEETQLYLREIMKITRPRMDKYDVAGNRILSPQAYLDKLNAMDEKEQSIFKGTITAPVTFKRNGEPHVVKVDHNLAPYLQQLADDGWGTGQSDSGTLSDHPNYRYVQNDREGRYVEGECIYYNKQGSSAYLTFWKPEATAVQKIGDVVNTQKQIDDIRRIATEQGWVIEDTDIFFQPSLRLTLPTTYDGTTKREILKEASRLTNEQYPGLYEKDFLQWLERRTPNEIKVQEAHGGVVMWSDSMIQKKWANLTQALVMVRKQDETMKRISDATTFLGGDGYWRIKCKIDGEQQLSVRLSDKEVKAIDAGTDAKEIAVDKYSKELHGRPSQGWRR